jgi:hypothetical protein
MINVQVLLNGKRIEFGVKSIEGLYALCIRKDVIIPIKSADDIYGINITNDLIILTKKDRAYRNGKELLREDDFGERSVNNIEAHDWNGNLVWNIGDIVGDIKKPFFGCNVVTGEMIKDDSTIKISESYATHDLLICNAGWLFVIDLKTNELLGKFPGGR